jgi:hypothetical protein
MNTIRMCCRRIKKQESRETRPLTADSRPRKTVKRSVGETEKRRKKESRNKNQESRKRENDRTRRAKRTKK